MSEKGLILDKDLIIELKNKYQNTEKRFLGIDYGSNNIGIAISDVSRIIASPYSVIKNVDINKSAIQIQKIVDEMDVSAIFIGLPLQMDGSLGDMAQKVQNFAKILQNTILNIELVFIDERLTSKMTERMLINDFDLSRNKRKQVIDKLSAAQILQTALDMR